MAGPSSFSWASPLQSSLGAEGCGLSSSGFFAAADFCFLPLANGTLGSVPPLYLDPLKILDSCFSLTVNFLQVSLAVPSFMNFLLKCNQIVAAKRHVSPNLGACSTSGESACGRINFSNFSFHSCSVIFGLLSVAGFKKCSGMLSCINGLPMAWRTRSTISCQTLLPGLKNECTLYWCVHAFLMCGPGLILLVVLPLLICVSLVVNRGILVVVVPLGLH